MKTRSNAPLIGIAFTTFIVIGLNAGLLGVAWPSIRDAFGLPLDAIGVLMLASTAVSLGINFYSGRIISHVGLGPLLTASCIVGGIGFLGYALSPAWWVMVAFGLVSSTGTAVLAPALNIYFAVHANARLLNWLNACFGLGATVSPVLLAAAIDRGYSWRWGYAVLVLCYGLLALCYGLTLGRWPRAERDSVGGDSSRATAAGSRDTLKLSAVWLSIALFFTFTGMEVSAGQWPYALFTEARGVDPAIAGFWASGYWASMTGGRILIGIVVNRIGVVPLVRTCIGAALCGAALIWWNLSDLVSFLALASIGFALSPLFPVLTSNTPQRLGNAHAANAIGFQLVAVRLGLATVPALAGALAEAWGLEVIGPFLLAVAVAMFALHEATLSSRFSVGTRAFRDAQR